MRELNHEQIAASRPESGISLVIAGAGTGKTSTMITKIKNVIRSSIVKPEEILILTFSRKAADEIRERVSVEFNSEFEPGFAGTFHSFALGLLKKNCGYYLAHRGLNSFPKIIDKNEKENILKRLILKNRESFLGLPADTVIYLMENINNLNYRIITKLKSGPLFDEINNIRHIFEEFKIANLLIEFEDMINHTSEILEKYPELQKKVTEKFRYIFVDEFQDTSENNFRLLSLLLPYKSKNLFMVGDDYQSIYKFRHSRVEYIINAEKFFPGITIHKLTVNYRSKNEIIKISNKFIRLNKFRTNKKIKSFRGKGGKVNFYNICDMNDESGVLNKIIGTFSCESAIAILYRNNYQGEYLEKIVKPRHPERNIKFLTMHGSKGLEFDIVIIAGISDIIIPDRATDIEEERRLFYVALTRAKNELHILFYKNQNGDLPRFIMETGYKKK